MLKPCELVTAEVWCQCRIDLLVILIEERELMRLEQTDIDRVEVERDHREEGETEEGPELILEGLLNEGQILETDAVGALDVDTRLVGGAPDDSGMHSDARGHSGRSRRRGRCRGYS